MAKYHINSKGQVGLCRAKQKCPFGGASGKENHFDSKQEAEQVQQARLKRTYGEMNGMKKAPKSTHASLKHFEEAGVPVNSISSVANHQFKKADSQVSSIDVLEEKPDAAFLQALREGRLQQFS